MKDIRDNTINNGDLCIRTSFADKKSVLVYCIVFEDKAFYIRPNLRTSKDDLIDDINNNAKPITSFKFEDYQIVKVTDVNVKEEVLRQMLLKKLANCTEKGNFSSKYIKMAQELLQII